MLEADRYAGTGRRALRYLLTHKSQLDELLQSETNLHIVLTQNIHDDDEISKEGGTVLLVFEKMRKWYNSLYIMVPELEDCSILS